MGLDEKHYSCRLQETTKLVVRGLDIIKATQPKHLIIKEAPDGMLQYCNLRAMTEGCTTCTASLTWLQQTLMWAPLAMRECKVRLC